MLYIDRLSFEMSLVFIPGILNTAVKVDSTGSSIKSILRKKWVRVVKNVVYSECTVECILKGMRNLDEVQ